MSKSPFNVLSVLLLLRLSVVKAHDEISALSDPMGHNVQPSNLGSALRIHIAFEVVAFTIILPSAVTLRVIGSNYYVPTLLTGGLAVLAGILVLGLSTKVSLLTTHSTLGYFIMAILLIQLSCATILAWKKGFQSLQKFFWQRHLDRALGYLFLLCSWIDIWLGVVVTLGICQNEFYGECLSHFAIGTSHVAYGIISLSILRWCETQEREFPINQDLLDSIVLTIWGCINAITTHKWGHAWVYNDLQHTIMGFLWVAGGLAGMWMAITGRRNAGYLSAIIFILTGLAMTAHPQSLALSAMVHSGFGYTLVAVGVSLVLRATDRSTFGYMTPLFLMAAGFLFVSAVHEIMAKLSSLEVSHVSLILGAYCLAFIVFLFTNIFFSLRNHERIAKICDYGVCIPNDLTTIGT